MAKAPNKAVLFIAEFIKSPKTIGAILPSGDSLSKAMSAAAGVAQSRSIIELGPGTGSFTGVILRQKSFDAGYIGIEINGHLVCHLREKYPAHSFINKSAEHIRTIVAEQGLSPVDCIVSGLPWAIFDPRLQDTILRGVYEVMSPGARFVTFTYIHSLPLPAGKRFRKVVGGIFSKVSISRPVWKNVPPAVMIICEK